VVRDGESGSADVVRTILCRDGERGADELHGCADVTADKLRIDAHDAIANAVQLALTPLVGGATEAMIAAIDLHDEPRARCEEIDDEVADGDLAPKRDAELGGVDLAPEALLGGRECDGGCLPRAARRVLERIA
jgi:hypothetical protein